MANGTPQYTRTTTLQPVAAPQVQSVYDKTASVLRAGGELLAKDITDINKDILNAEAESATLQGRTTLDNIKNSVLDPKNFGDNSLEDYRSQAAGVIEGILPNVDSRIRKQVQNNLSFYALQHQNTVATQTRQLKKNQLTADLQKALDAKQLDSLNQAYDAGVDQKDPQRLEARNNAKILFAQGKTLVNSALNSGLINGAQAAAITDDWKAQLQEQAYLGGMKHAIMANTAADYIKKFDDTKHPDITPMQKASLLTKMNGMITRNREAQGISLNQLKTEMDDTLLQVQNGDNKNVPQILGKLESAYPERAEQFKTQIQGAQLYHNVVETTRYMNPVEAANYVAKNQPDINQAGVSVLTKYYNQALHVIDQNHTAFANDPAGFTMGHPAVVAAINQRKMQDDIDPAQAQLNLERQMGATEHAGAGQAHLALVPKAAAAQIVQEIQSATPTQQLDLINSALVSFDPTTKVDPKTGRIDYGRHSQIIINDLVRNGLPQSTATTLAMANNKDSLPYLPAMIDAASSTEKELKDALPAGMKVQDIRDSVKDKMQTYIDSLTGYNGATTETIADAYNDATKLAMVLARKKGHFFDSSNIDDAAEKAVNATTMYHYEFDTMNGQTYRIPKGTSKSRTRQAIDAIKYGLQNETLQVPNTFAAQYPWVAPEELQRLYRDDIQSNGYAVTSPDNSGLILVNSIGTPIRSPDGHRYSFTFADMNNPQSDLSDIIDSQPIRPHIHSAVLSLLPYDTLREGANILGLRDLGEKVQHITRALLPQPKELSRLDKLKIMEQRKRKKEQKSKQMILNLEQ